MPRPQFSLRTLMLLMIALGVGIGTHGWWLPRVMELHVAFIPIEERPIEWQEYSAERLAEAKQSGKPVLINFDADWTVATVVNRAVAFERPTVRRLIDDYEIVPIHGDCTYRENEAFQSYSDYCTTLPCTVIVDPSAPEQPCVSVGLINEKTVVFELSKATRFQPRPQRWEAFQSPVVGLIGVLLLIAGAHLLGHRNLHQKVDESETLPDSMDGEVGSATKPAQYSLRTLLALPIVLAVGGSMYAWVNSDSIPIPPHFVISVGLLLGIGLGRLMYRRSLRHAAGDSDSASSSSSDN